MRTKILFIIIVLSLPINILAQGKPDHIRAKVAAIRAGVQSTIEAKTAKTNTVRAKQGDMVLVHDGRRVDIFKSLDPLDKMSVPSSLTVFVGNKQQVNAEIQRLKITGTNRHEM